MLKATIELPVPEIRRFFSSAVFTAALCIGTFLLSGFTADAVQRGFKKTSTTLLAGFSDVFDRVVVDLERLSEYPEDMGSGACVIRRIPYLGEATPVFNKDSLVGIDLGGANLDCLESFSVGDHAFSRTSDDKPAPGTFRVDPGSGSSLSVMLPAGKGEGLAPTEVFLLTDRHRDTFGYKIIIKERKYLEERDIVEDTVKGSHALGSRIHPGNGSASASPTAPASAAAPPDRGSPVAGIGDMRHQFQALVERLQLNDPQVKDGLIRKSDSDALQWSDVRDLLWAVQKKSDLKPEVRQTLFVEILTQPYLTTNLGPGRRKLVSRTPAQVKAAVELGTQALLQEIANAADIDGGLDSGVRGTSYATTGIPGGGTPASPGADPDAPGTGGTPGAGSSAPESEYLELFKEEREYRKCMELIDSVLRAHEAYNSNALTSRPLDLEQLRAKGFLAFVPYCAQGGAYQVSANKQQLRCPRHGSRIDPSESHQKYQAAFRDYDQARILAGQPNGRRQAIEKLKAHLKAHPRNAYGRVLLGELYHQAEQFEEALELIKPLAESHPKNVRFRYIVGYAFYVKGNLILGKENLEAAAYTLPQDFDFTLSEDSLRYEYYQMQEKAVWCLRNICRGVKFVDFKIMAEPPLTSRACLHNLQTIAAALPEIAKLIREGKKGSNRYDLLDARFREISQRIASTPEYRAEEKKKLYAELDTKREVLWKTVEQTLKAYAEKKGPVRFDPCPQTRFGPHLPECPAKTVETEDGQVIMDAPVRVFRDGTYYLTDTFEIQCSAHPDLFPSAKLSRDPDRDPRWESQVLSLIILSQTLAGDSMLKQCLRRQSEVLKVAFETPESPGIYTVTHMSMEELVRNNNVESSIIHPDDDAILEVVLDDTEPRLHCEKHHSLQKIVQVKAGSRTDEYFPFQFLYMGF